MRLDEVNLTTVWDRRPERPSELPINGTEAINKHNLEEAIGFLRFLRSYIAKINQGTVLWFIILLLVE